MSTRNQQTVHIISAAGAHSKNGKFTERGHAEAPNTFKATKNPMVVDTGIAGITATIKASNSNEQAILTLNSETSVASLLPEELDESAKHQWLEDHELLLNIHTDLGIDDEWHAASESIEIPTTKGAVDRRDLATAVQDSAQARWDKHLNGQLGEMIRADGFHGYRPGDNPQLTPGNVPYTVEGDAAELTGHQRATALALFQEHEGKFFRASSNFYGRAYAEWSDESGRQNTLFISPDGKIERAEIAPIGWETKPWLTPVLNNEPKFLAMMERYEHKRATFN